MPELPIKKPQIALDFENPKSRQDLEDKIYAGHNEGKTDLKTLTELYPETEYLGRGAEALVIGHPENPEKVVAFDIMDRGGYFTPGPIRALEIYHLHRILSTLFPHNFPKFYAVRGGDNAQSIRERVVKSSESKIRFPFKGVKEACEVMGMPLSVDLSKHNFVKTEDGGEYYLDRVMTDNDSLPFESLDLLKLKEFMNSQKIDLVEQRRVLLSLQRLGELEIISAIEYGLVKDPALLIGNWLDLSISYLGPSARLLKDQSYKRIKRFVELIEVPEGSKEKKEKVLQYFKEKIANQTTPPV